jgi:hypothetical protein
MALALLAISAFVYADNAYQVGFDQGYRNGINDKQGRIDFNYENSYRSCECMSNNSYTDSQFREGYKDGYVEGYSKGIYVIKNSDRPVYRNYEVRTDEQPVYRTYTVRSYGDRRYDDRRYLSDGFVIAFKKDDFRGDLAQFPMGRYPDLDKMNWEDKIESMQIPSTVRVVLFDDENFKGRSLILESNAADLSDYNFKKKAESMIIEPRY